METYLLTAALAALILTVGGLALTSLHGLRGELRELRGELRELRGELRALDVRVGRLEQRVARIEGLIEGLLRPVDSSSLATGDPLAAQNAPR